MRKLWKHCQKKFKIQIEGEIEMCKKKILLCILIIIFIVFFIKFKFFPFFIAIFIIYIMSDGFYLKNLYFKIINLKEIFLLKNLEKIIILIFSLFIGIYFLYYTSVVLSYYKEVSIFRNKIKNSKIYYSENGKEIVYSKDLKNIFLKELNFSNIFKKTYPYNISFDKKYYFYNDKNEEIVFYNNNCESWDTIFKFRGYQDHVNIKVRDHNICQKIIKEISDSK